MFKYELLEDPYRSDNWYGNRFDELYDLGMVKLRFYTEMKRLNLYKK